MNALAVIGIGIIMSVCLYWFYIIFHKDRGFSWLSEEWRLGPRGAYAGIIMALCAGGIVGISFVWISYVIVYLYLSRTIKVPPSMIERGFFGSPQPNAVYNGLIGSLSGILNWSLLAFYIAISVVLFIIRLYIIKGNSRKDIRRRQSPFFRPDDFPSRVLPPKRLLIPTASAFILVVGGLVYNIILFVDPHAAVHAINSIPSALEIPPSIIKAVNASSNLGRCSVFALALILKSYLGPIITGYVLSTEFYTLISYGNFQPVPIISSILNWVFQGFPVWASTAYLVIQVGYNVFSNGIETITDLGHHH